MYIKRLVAVSLTVGTKALQGRRVAPKGPAAIVFSVLSALAFLAAGASASSPTAGSPTQTIRVAGLEQPAEILVDRYGVPHIFARTAQDAFFAQGFNAARARLFQIDLWRRRGLALPRPRLFLVERRLHS